jgi:hypothetical protein
VGYSILDRNTILRSFCNSDDNKKRVSFDERSYQFDCVDMRKRSFVCLFVACDDRSICDDRSLAFRCSFKAV